MPIAARIAEARGVARVASAGLVAHAVSLAAFSVFTINSANAECAAAACASGARSANIEASEHLNAEISSDSPAWLFTGEMPTSEADGVGSPVAVTPSADGFSARASTSTWRDSARKALNKRIEAAKSLSAKPLTIPKASPQRDPKLDVWSGLNVKGANGAAETSARASIGADYKATRSATLGVSAERGEVASATASEGVSQDDKVSAYVNLKAAPMMSIDTRTEWQSSHAGASAGTDAQTSDKAAVIVAPKIGKAFALPDKTTVEPFVNYKRAFEIGGDAVAADSAGAGVTLAEPDSYALWVTTDVEGLSDAREQTLKGKVQFKVPLP